MKLPPNPVAWMWQHDETGRTGFVGVWERENGFEKHNPRLTIVCPLYNHPPSESQELSDEEIISLFCDAAMDHLYVSEGNQIIDSGNIWVTKDIISFARMLLGEKK